VIDDPFPGMNELAATRRILREVTRRDLDGQHAHRGAVVVQALKPERAAT